MTKVFCNFYVKWQDTKCWPYLPCKALSFFIQLHATTLNNAVLVFPSGKSGLPISKQEPFDAHGLQWLRGFQSQLLKCKQEETHPSHRSAPSADIAFKDTFFGLCSSVCYSAWKRSWVPHTRAGRQRKAPSPSPAPGLMAALYEPRYPSMGSRWDKDNSEFISEFCVILSLITSYRVSCFSALASDWKGAGWANPQRRLSGG